MRSQAAAKVSCVRSSARWTSRQVNQEAIDRLVVAADQLGECLGTTRTQAFQHESVVRLRHRFATRGSVCLPDFLVFTAVFSMLDENDRQGVGAKRKTRIASPGTGTILAVVPGNQSKVQ